MVNPKYTLYIRETIPESLNPIQNGNFLDVEIRKFSIIRRTNAVKIRGLDFLGCPIILAGNNDDHGLAYDIFKEYFKQRKPKEAILDVRDYHSDCFEEKYGKSWSWVRRLAKDYPEINQIRVYCCKDAEHSPQPKVIISPKLPNKAELNELKQSKKVITSIDLDFLHLNNFKRADFNRIINSLMYKREYLDIYFADGYENLKQMQKNFINIFLKALFNNEL